MPSTITIAGLAITGTSHYVADSTLGFTEALNARNTLSIKVVSDDGSYAPDEGNPITWEMGGITYFGGTIDQITKRANKHNSQIETDCLCVSWDALFGRRYTGYQERPAETAGARIKWLIDHRMQSEGLTYAGVDDGPMLEAVVWDFPMTAKEAMDQTQQLANASGTDFWYWDVTPGKDVRLYSNSTAIHAPFEISDANPNCLADGASVTRTREKLCNRVLARCQKLITDPVTETYPGDGSGRQFATSKTMAAAPTVTLDGTAQTVGIYGTDTGKNWYWNLDSNILYEDDAGALLTSGNSLAITYSGYEARVLGPFQASASVDARALKEGGTGYYELCLDFANPATAAQVEESCWAYLAIYADAPETFSFPTRVVGLRAGQALWVSLAKLSIASTLLIESVSCADNAGIYTWTVKATDGALLGDWKKKLKDLATGSGITLSGSGAGGTSAPPPADTIVEVTNTDVTLTGGAQTVIVHAVTRACAVTLQSALGMVGKADTIKSAPDSAHDVTYAAASGQTIDGSGSAGTISAPGASITVRGVSATDWALVASAGDVIVPPVADAPNITAATCAPFYCDIDGTASATGTLYGMTGTVTLPTADANYAQDKIIHIILTNPSPSTRSQEICTLYQRDFPIVGSSLAWSTRGDWNRPTSDDRFQKIEFVCENADAKTTPSPYTISTFAALNVTGQVPGAPTSPVVSVLDQLGNFGLRTSWTAPASPGNLAQYDREVQYYSDSSATTSISGWIPLGSIDGASVTADSGFWPRPTVATQYPRLRVRGSDGGDHQSAWVMSGTPLPAIAVLAAPTAPTAPVVSVLDQTGNFGLRTAWTNPGAFGSTIGYNLEVRYYSDSGAVTAVSDWIPLGSAGIDVATADSGWWARPGIAQYVRFRIRGENVQSVKSAWVLSPTPLPVVSVLAAPTAPTSPTLTVTDFTANFGLHCGWTNAAGTTVGYNLEVQYSSGSDGTGSLSGWIPLGSAGTDVTSLDGGPWPRQDTLRYVRLRIRGYNSLDVKTAWVYSTNAPCPAVTAFVIGTVAAPPVPTNASTISNPLVLIAGVPSFRFHLVATSGGGTTVGWVAQVRYYSDSGAATPTSAWIPLGTMDPSTLTIDTDYWPAPLVQDYAKIRIAAQNSNDVLSAWVESAILTRLASVGFDLTTADPAKFDSTIGMKSSKFAYLGSPAAAIIPGSPTVAVQDGPLTENGTTTYQLLATWGTLADANTVSVEGEMVWASSPSSPVPLGRLDAAKTGGIWGPWPRQKSASTGTLSLYPINADGKRGTARTFSISVGPSGAKTFDLTTADPAKVSGLTITDTLHPSTAPKNWIQNGSFEDGLTHWLISPPLYQDVGGHRGLYAVTLPGLPGNGWSNINQPELIPVEPGSLWAYSMWIQRVGANGEAKYAIYWLDKNKVSLNAGANDSWFALTVAGFPNGVWAEATQQVTVPAGASYAQVIALIGFPPGSGGASAGYWVMDDVSFSEMVSAKEVQLTGPLVALGDAITLANASITNTYIGPSAVQSGNMAAGAVTAANAALAAGAVVDGNIVSVGIPKLTAGTQIFSGDVILSRGTNMPCVVLGSAGLTLFGMASGSAGLTGYPYAVIKSDGLALYSGDSSHPSVLLNGSGLNLYSVQNNTGWPYVVLTSSGLTIVGLSGYKLLMDSTGIKLTSGSYSTLVAASGIVLAYGSGAAKITFSDLGGGVIAAVFMDVVGNTTQIYGGTVSADTIEATTFHYNGVAAVTTAGVFGGYIPVMINGNNYKIPFYAV